MNKCSYIHIIEKDVWERMQEYKLGDYKIDEEEEITKNDILALMCRKMIFYYEEFERVKRSNYSTQEKVIKFREVYNAYGRFLYFAAELGITIYFYNGKVSMDDLYLRMFDMYGEALDKVTK